VAIRDEMMAAGVGVRFGENEEMAR